MLRFTVSNIPLGLAIVVSPKLLQGIERWERLTHLCLKVHQPQDAEGRGGGPEVHNPRTPPSFPGLSFLASGIWKNHPRLTMLEYYFDRNLIEQEDLSDSLNACDDLLQKSSGAHPRYYPAGHHSLRTLRINTGSAVSPNNDGGLALSVTRKVRIAVFLDHLFPALESVGGSAKDVWSEIDTLVKSYQEQRAYFEMQVDNVLAGY